MKYSLVRPCVECPFLPGFTISVERLREFAENGQFACRKHCEVDEEAFVAKGPDTPCCAGALIALEKASRPNQMMRISERLGFYDRSKLDMSVEVTDLYPDDEDEDLCSGCNELHDYCEEDDDNGD